jgi:hypothetical protein
MANIFTQLDSLCNRRKLHMVQKKQQNVNGHISHFSAILEEQEIISKLQEVVDFLFCSNYM